jgi:hypothetical protein
LQVILNKNGGEAQHFVVNDAKVRSSLAAKVYATVISRSGACAITQPVGAIREGGILGSTS